MSNQLNKISHKAYTLSRVVYFFGNTVIDPFSNGSLQFLLTEPTNEFPSKS